MKEPETTFYLVRHGETEWNRDHRMQGWLDSPLTELGKQQAIRLRGNFRDIKFDRVLSSDSQRAISTTRLIIGDSRPIITLKALRERNYGPYEGQLSSKYLIELGEKLAFVKTLSDGERRRFRLSDGIETGQEILDRFVEVVEQERKQYPGNISLVISHGSILREAIGYFDSEATGLSGLFIRNGGYMKVVHNGRKYAIEEMVDVEKAKE